MAQIRRPISFLLTLALLAGCSGGPSRLIPAGAPNGGEAPAIDAAATHASVSVTLRVPRRRRDERTALHPGTISGETLSVGISVNGGALQTFNVTPSSPGCTAGASGTTCTLHAAARVGIDKFAVSTYSAINAGGAMLDRGTITATIARGKANAPHITLGPVVSTSADSGPGSLRDAVVNANPGDTIMFVIPATSTITLTSPITIAKNATISGPGFTAAGTAYTGVKVSGKGATQLFIVPDGTVATISGLILENGKANVAKSPGGVVANKGALDLVADALVGNTSTVQATLRARPVDVVTLGKLRENAGLHPHCTATNNEGGAVYNAGALAIDKTTFDSNTVKSTFEAGGCASGLGGAIYNDGSGSMAIAGSVFKNNGAYEGGAVYNAASGGVIFDDDTFTRNTGCNTAALGCAIACTTTCSSFATGSGAAVYDDAGPGVTINGGTFSYNIAGGSVLVSAGSGGALYLATGNPVVKNASFYANQAGGGTAHCSLGNGGAIDATVPLSLISDTFSGNVASGDFGAQGGAVVDNGGDITGNGNTFTSNTAQGFGGSACAPTAAAGGGAIFTAHAAPLTSTTFSKNHVLGTADAYGGALQVGLATTLHDYTFDRNTVVTSGVGASSPTAEGGAVNATAPLTLTNDAITNNTATLDGSTQNQVTGGAVNGTSTISMSYNTVSGNKAIEGSSGGGSAFGGAVYSSGIFSSSNDTFSTNTAAGLTVAAGGAVYGNAQVNLNKASFDHNKVTQATTGDGGALYIGGSGGGISIGTFTNNTATDGLGTGNGGAIYDAGGATFGSLTLTQNSALSAGGGLYAGANDDVDVSTITLNTVTDAHQADGGGGIFDDGTMTVDQSTISSNTVTLHSGTIVAGGGGIFDDNGLTLTSSTVAGNIVNGSTSVPAGGAGILAYDAATIVNSTIVSNVSSADGGGIDALYSTTTLYNVSLYANYTFDNGGNIEGWNGLGLAGSYVIANSAIGQGTASSGSGADVDIEGTNQLSDSGYNVVQTAATGGGGSFSAANHDVTGDPLLSALANNGGSTQTEADGSSSPGKQLIPFSGTGSSSKCGNISGIVMSTDKRGYARGAGSACDAGAYEYAGVAPAIRIHITPKRTIGRHKQHPKRPHGAVRR